MSAALRKKAYDRICYCFSVMYADLLHHQRINDLSLNIHSENFFRDVFNDVYSCNFENANFGNQNADCVDLVDTLKKKAVQITSTTSSDKIYKTLQALNTPQYKDYAVEVYYLLGKPNFNVITKNKVESDFKIDVNTIIKDSTDITYSVNNLATDSLIKLSKKYFNDDVIQYTLNEVLQITCRQLINDMAYADEDCHLSDFDLKDPKEKIKLNNIDETIGIKILSSLNFAILIDDLSASERTDLENLIVKDIYYKFLIAGLSSFHRRSEINSLSIEELNELARQINFNLTPVLKNTYKFIKDKIILKDYNSVSIPWIIIAYFFELCEIGRKDFNDTSK